MKDSISKKSFASALRYLKRHRALVAANIFALLVASALEGLGVGMLIPLMESLSKNTTSSIFMKYAVGLCNLLHVKVGFQSLLLIFGAIMILGFLVIGLQQYLTKLLQLRVTYELRKDAFRNLMDVPIGYYYNKKIGDIIATIHLSTFNAGAAFYYSIQFVVDVAFCLVYIYVNSLLSLTMMLSACLLLVLSYFFIVPRFRLAFSHGKESKEMTDRFISFLVDKLGGIKTVKSFNAEGIHQEQFDTLCLDYNKMLSNVQSNVIKANLCAEPFLAVLIVVLTLIAVGVFHINIAGLVAFFYIFSRMISKIKAANSDYMQIMELLPHFTTTEELIRRDDKLYLKDGQLHFSSIKQVIKLEDVWFRYNTEDDYVLKGISFMIEKGKTTAILGSSGSGKTTLIGLLMRYYDPDKGQISVDSVDLRDIKRQSWSRLISIVEQDAYLFHDTVYNNILYGRPDTTKEEVIRAAQLAYADGFITEFSDKYETVVGERGMRLSGGQKQRIALARALIRDPEILILDEATSALDSESEQLIQKSIQELGGRKTIIVIAHRLSTVAIADKLVVIEEGRVVEEGNHKELMDKKGIYEKYHQLQYQNNPKKGIKNE